MPAAIPPAPARERLTRQVSNSTPGHGEAVFNQPRTHRYLLIRTWKPTAKRLTWIMLNPSTADALADDPTIRRILAFTRREGYGAVAVVNLFGLRSADPRALRRHPDPVGQRNDEFITGQCQPGRAVAVAWGARGMLHGRALQVTAALLERGADLRCLGLTRNGQPAHPLYRPASTPLVPYPAPAEDGPGPGGWACDRCGYAYYGTPPEHGLCPACTDDL